MSRGVLPKIGVSFLAMGLFFLLAFLNPQGIARAALSNLDPKMVDGTVVSVSTTNVTVNEERVMAVAADYSAAGRSLRVTSYSTHPLVAEGDVVGVRFSASMPTMAVIDGLSAMTMPLWALPFLLIFPGVGAGLALVQIRRGRQQAMLLERGLEAEGTFVAKEPSNTRVNNRPVMRVTFHFQDSRGDTWPAVALALDTTRLEDEPTERVLYLPERPAVALVVDEIPAWLTATSRGWAEPPSGDRLRPVYMAIAVLAATAAGLALGMMVG